MPLTNSESISPVSRLYNGVRLIRTGPCLPNVERLDLGARPMIAHMMQRGLQVDLSHFAKMDVELTQDMERITEEVQQLTGVYTNLGSGDQVSHLLFKRLGLKQARPKMTRSGDRESVENEVLVAVQHDHPVVPKCLEYKEVEKLRGTYVRPMPKLAKRTKFGVWRMFPKLGDTRVPSGRLNCKEPNLLAMPSRTDRGREIRKGFITDTGWVYLSVDESQIEVRVAADNSEDKNLMHIYETGMDIYSDFAISAFKLKDNRYLDLQTQTWKFPSVDKMEHRYPAKTCILASIYDVTAKGLLEQMPVICATCHLPATLHTCSKFVSLWNENNCQDLINAFYLRYPGLLMDRKRTHARARKHGYVWDMWGRLLHVQAVRSIHPWVVSAALREAGNLPYQGGAQGTIKLTMAAVQDDLEQGHLLDICQPLLQIHDELLFEVQEDMAEEIAAYVKWRFETCVELRVPIKAGASTAPTWGSIAK